MQAKMLTPAHFLLLLLLLPVAPGSGLSPGLYKAESIFGCINTALAEAKESQLEAAQPLSKRGADGQWRGPQEDSNKRPLPGPRLKHPAPMQPRGRLSLDKSRGDRRTKLTLSLDVPTSIMNVLFDIAKARNLRAKAAANAHLMAQIGRRK